VVHTKEFGKKENLDIEYTDEQVSGGREKVGGSEQQYQTIQSR